MPDTCTMYRYLISVVKLGVKEKMALQHQLKHRSTNNNTGTH